MPSVLKIYGERNSGTNYLSQLIALNLPQVRLLPGVVPRWLQLFFPRAETPRDLYFQRTFKRNLGWKHAMAPTAEQLAHVVYPPQHLYFVTLTKNPYAWLLSLYRRPYHLAGKKPESFLAFLQQPWPVVRRENYDQPQFQNPIDMWNQKNHAYIRLKNYALVLHLRYEDLLASPEQAVARIADFVHQPLTTIFRNIERSTKGDPLDFSSYQTYYLQEAWREKLSSEEIRYINSFLDPNVVSFFGYTLLEG